MKVYGFRFHNVKFEEVSYHVKLVKYQFEVLIFTGHISLFIGSLNYVPSKEKTQSSICFFPFKITTRQFKKLKELWKI